MLVLIYLILASGDLFLQKLVRVMPTLKDKKEAIEFSHEIQQNISNYLFAVTLINAVLGALVAAGLYAHRGAEGRHVGHARGRHQFRPLFRAGRS